MTQSVDAAALEELLRTLAREDCVHSWKNFGERGTSEELLRWENAYRPTELFFFHLKRGDTLRLVAASAVASTVNRSFPHPGFCVLGRCCIMPEFRGRGFYRRILQRRLDHCQTRYASLKAIHIGAVDLRVSHVITSHPLSAWPPFVHLGQERLTVSGKVRSVGAYLLLMPDYQRELERAVQGARPPRPVRALRRTLALARSGAVRELGALVQRDFGPAKDSGWFDDHDLTGFEQLLSFCRAVPLVGFAPAGA